ncbi:MAG: SH3 domain-containing protein [Ruegeria sp.]|uniref:SH3 domain-containing protein n=1 Tax=Ruegeria sp. TaxID=1879320 RepID=UPI00349E8462
MKRIIVVSFAFLGLVFYEMSGGADFEPRGVRAPKAERVAKVAPPKATPVPVTVNAETLVAKDVIEVVTEVRAQPEPAESSISQEEGIARLAQAASGLSSGLTLFDENAGSITLASLEQGGAALQQTAVATEPAAEPTAVVEPQPDIREVMGTRVNMRDGPGTIYPVIARLNIGHKVEIMDDSGTGWLRLRVLPEQQVGWISASLISKKAN